MFEHKKLTDLNAFFKSLNARAERGVYFIRINGYNPAINDFVREYYDYARKKGVIIEGGIQNPESRHIEYYTEMMGSGFQMDPAFLRTSLSKWLPRMSPSQQEAVSSAIYSTLTVLRNDGKSEGVLKNCYIKFMCWLYYRFERLVSQLGNDDVPKILYEGNITNHELLLLSVLSKAGCDIVLLQYQGDAGYQKLDAASRYSDALTMSELSAFPPDFNLKKVRKEIQELFDRQRLYGTPPEIAACTNAWCSGKGFEDIRQNPSQRGEDRKLFYNCFCRISGVEEKQTYPNVLYQLRQELKQNGRHVLVLDNPIPPPKPEESEKISRKNYTKVEDMVADLSANLRIVSDVQLQRLIVRSFVDMILDEAKQEGMQLQKLTNDAMHLICWMNRFHSVLLPNWKLPEVGCLIILGGCKTRQEALFVRFLARLPIDVLILMPDLSRNCLLEDTLLYEIHYETSFVLEQYPRESSDLRLGTTAYHAERELDTLMYQDSGIYRSQQYAKADSLTLRTMYEELFILWNQESRFRPNFGTVGDVVNVPVLFAKVSGVKDGNASAYWQSVEKLTEGDPFIVTKVPFINGALPNPIKNNTSMFFSGQKLRKDAIRQHGSYRYGLLRDEVQNHILDKLEMMLDQRLINGTFENGVEHTIVATILNLPLDLVRRIQSFDFTKVPPKLLYVNVGEKQIPIEDAIVAAFLNLIGFDVLFLIPTGYRSVEAYYRKPLIEEHQVGEYLYDMRVPNLYRSAEKAKKSAAKAKSGGFKIFKKRGN